MNCIFHDRMEGRVNNHVVSRTHFQKPANLNRSVYSIIIKPAREQATPDVSITINVQTDIGRSWIMSPTKELLTTGSKLLRLNALIADLQQSRPHNEFQNDGISSDDPLYPSVRLSYTHHVSSGYQRSEAVPANKALKNLLHQLGGPHHPQKCTILDVSLLHRDYHDSTLLPLGGSRVQNASHSNSTYLVGEIDSAKRSVEKGQHRPCDLGNCWCKTAFLD